MTIVSDRGKEFLNSAMVDLCGFLGINHNATSSYHPQTNSQAETYNKTMIRYLASMLDNSHTLDWEEQLPAMMMSYNCHVQRATHETPFFLTFLHSPRLPYFDLDKPRLLYGEDYASLAFNRMKKAYRQVKENLESARDAREVYFNRKTKDRVFAVGDKILVKFPKVPRGVNPKFYKKWKGIYEVIKVVGRLNLLVQQSPHNKPILIHVDRARHLTLAEKESAFDSRVIIRDYKEPQYTDESDCEEKDKESDSADPEIGPGSQGQSAEEKSAQDFSEYVDVPDKNNGQAQGAAGEAASEIRPRLTRAGAQRQGVHVENIPLPRHCPSSKRGRKT